MACGVAPDKAAQLHDELLAAMPAGARHDSDICPFCVERAAQSNATASENPPAESRSDGNTSQSIRTTEGGTNKSMSDDNKEAMVSMATHEALLEKALREGTAELQTALTAKTDEAAQVTARVTELEAEVASLKTDNARLNSELDTAQISLRAATDEVASLKTDIAERENKARKAEIASARATQVKNLKLFSDEYVTEKAEAWADLAEAAWDEKLDEWRQLKPASTDEASEANTDSAMTGTSGGLTETPPAPAENIPARRRALGLN